MNGGGPEASKAYFKTGDICMYKGCSTEALGLGDLWMCGSVVVSTASVLNVANER